MKRESRKARRRRVIRNRILAISALVALLVVVIVLVTSCLKKRNADPETTGSADITTTSQEETTKKDAESTETEETTPEETTPQGNPDDVTGPVIYIVNNINSEGDPDSIHVALGKSISYKSYVQVTDDYDDAPVLSVDNSEVDLSTAGTYTVHYTATDASGNSTVKDAYIVVEDAGEPDVEDSVIFAQADDLLSRIVTDDMSDLQKVFAVFYYVRNNCTYVKDSTYWNYKQEAYQFMMNGLTDNCYANVCLSKLLLERLGFESIMVQGDLGYVDEHHYWNMVSIDGGNTWYHYDSAWWTWMYEEYPCCMMTDALAQEISSRHGGLWVYDQSSYPVTPDEPIWTDEDLAYLG